MLTQVVAGRTYDYSHAVAGRFIVIPISVALGAGDVVYMLGRPAEYIGNVHWSRTGGFAKVDKMTIGTTPGDEQYLGEFGKYGLADGQFIWPTAIAVDSDERLYITDEWLHRVIIIDNEGNFLEKWDAHGDGDGQLDGPTGIAIDREDNVYVVDGRNHRVQKFTRDGRFLAKWGHLGDRPGEFHSPWGIGVDGDGFVYVADYKNHRAQKFTPDGQFVSSFGSYGTGRGELNHPADVAVDTDGDVYVCDWANNRVQAYDADGKFLTTFIGDAQHLGKWHQEIVDANTDVIRARRRAYTLEPEWRFVLPTGVEFDPVKQRLMVVDTQRSRIQIYNKLKNYMEPQFNL